jgi:rhomboid protease GluP
MDPQEPRITETLLSRKPRNHSFLVATLSLLAILNLTMLGWRSGPEPFGGMAASPEKILVDGEYWRLLTSMAVHADISHFASNAVFIGFFGFLLYGYFGFWVYPVWCLLLGGLTTYLSVLTYPPNAHLVGASGLVYLMAGFWLTIYVLVERRHSRGKRLLQAIGFAVLVFFPTSFHEQISYRTHAIGFGLGLVQAMAFFQLYKSKIRSAEVVEGPEKKRLKVESVEPEWAE